MNEAKKTEQPSPIDIAAKVLDDLSARLMSTGDLQGSADAALGRSAIRLLVTELVKRDEAKRAEEQAKVPVATEAPAGNETPGGETANA